MHYMNQYSLSLHHMVMFIKKKNHISGGVSVVIVNYNSKYLFISFFFVAAFFKSSFFFSFQPPFKCLQCDRSFNSVSSLRRHNNKHIGVYPYLCQFCSKGLSTRRELYEHLSTHTNESYFVCDVCPSSFKTLYQLRKHQRQIHKLDVPKR